EIRIGVGDVAADTDDAGTPRTQSAVRENVRQVRSRNPFHGGERSPDQPAACAIRNGRAHRPRYAWERSLGSSSPSIDGGPAARTRPHGAEGSSDVEPIPERDHRGDPAVG